MPLSGTLWVAVGTALLGASGYAYLTLTARRVPDDEYAALASLYLLVALVGPGVFLPLEQETTRLISRAQALGEGTRHHIRQIGRLAAGMTAIAVVVLVALYPFLVDRVFHGDAGAWFALTVSVVGWGGACVVRGVYAGQRRLKAYAACLGADGLTRLVPCAAFAFAGLSTAFPYGMALGLGSVVAFLAVLPWFRAGQPGPTVSWRDLVSATGWLMAAWGLSLGLANIAPVVATALMHDDPRLAGIFAFASVIARLPLFVLFSVQPIILPSLARAVAKRDGAGLAGSIRKALFVVGAIGAVALVTTAPVCWWLLESLFEAGSALSVVTLTLLALGTIFAMLIQVLQPALLAVAGHRLIAAAWLLGALAFAGSFMLPLSPVDAATLAQVAGVAATAAVMAAALRRHLRTAATPTTGGTP